MEITLLGTGDTTGTPTPGCACDTCTRAKEESVERSRFSVHVHNPRRDRALLIDASPDFRHQFLAQGVPLPSAVIITHVHFDHLHGLGNAYRLLDNIAVHAASATDPETGESVAETVARRYDYLDAITVEGHADHSSFKSCGLEVQLVPVVHPPLVSYGVTVRDPETGGMLALTGDTAWDVPDASREAMHDVDLLLADGIVPASLCQYHPLGGDHHDEDGVPRTFGTKHMTFEGALQFGEQLDASETRIVHVSHFTPAEEAFAEPLAVDGEHYTL